MWVEEKSGALYSFNLSTRTWSNIESFLPVEFATEQCLYRLLVQNDVLDFPAHFYQNPEELKISVEVLDTTTIPEYRLYMEGKIVDFSRSLLIKKSPIAKITKEGISIALSFSSKKKPIFILLSFEDNNAQAFHYLSVPIVVISNTSQFSSAASTLLETVCFQSASTIFFGVDVSKEECKPIMWSLLMNSRISRLLSDSDFDFLLKKAGFSEKSTSIKQASFNHFWKTYFVSAFETLRKQNKIWSNPLRILFGFISNDEAAKVLKQEFSLRSQECVCFTSTIILMKLLQVLLMKDLKYITMVILLVGLWNLLLIAENMSE